jgi:hypothetical protein
MQDYRKQGGESPDGLFGRWRVRLAQAVLREPSVVLIDRDADAPASLLGRDDPSASSRAIMN